MAQEIKPISKSISILYRLSQMYYDVELGPCQIGCGQQFFLLMIHRNPGISPYELAQNGVYDKGTTTRAIKKLENLGYIERRQDMADKRSCKLFLTASAQGAVERTNQVLEEWNTIITRDFTEEDAALAARLLDKLATNARLALRPERKD